MNPHPLVIRYSAGGRWLDDQLACPGEWLSSAEQSELALLRNPPRRLDWLRGRWVAKQLIRQATGIARLADIGILTRSESGLGIRPRIFVAGGELPWSLSISHTLHGALAGLARSSEYAVGVDLVHGTARGSGFRQLWFSRGEQRWLQEAPSRRTTVLWALKEAVYKACNQGEPWRPQQIEVLPSGDRFHCSYRGKSLCSLGIEVRSLDRHIAAVVCVPRGSSSSDLSTCL